MFVVSIKARQINRRQKRVLFYQVAQTEKHARLNFDKSIVERIRVRQPNVVIVGAANREMKARERQRASEQPTHGSGSRRIQDPWRP